MDEDCRSSPVQKVVRCSQGRSCARQIHTLNSKYLRCRQLQRHQGSGLLDHQHFGRAQLLPLDCLHRGGCALPGARADLLRSLFVKRQIKRKEKASSQLRVISIKPNISTLHQKFECFLLFTFADFKLCGVARMTAPCSSLEN